jgi:hypothetical protein
MVNKVKLSLYLIKWAPPHEDVWRREGIAPPVLISVLDDCEWSESHPGRFTPGERVPGTHWAGGAGDWVGPRVGLYGLYAVVRRKISFLPVGYKTPAVQLVALCYKGLTDKFSEFIYESLWDRTSLGYCT